MNTITINHKGETINLAAFSQHEQADIADHFDQLAESFNSIAAALSKASKNPDQAEAMIRKALAEAYDSIDLAEGWAVEYFPAA